MVTASRDKKARIWNAKTGEPIGVAIHHDDAVWVAAFSPDGATILTASEDKSARLWEASTGRQIGAPLRHADAVLFAAFSFTRLVHALVAPVPYLWRPLQVVIWNRRRRPRLAA